MRRGLLSSSEDTGPDDRERCIHPLHPPLLPFSSHLPHSPRFFFLSFPAYAHTCTHTARAGVCLEFGPRVSTAGLLCSFSSPPKKTVQANCCFAQKKIKRNAACSLLCDCLSFFRFWFRTQFIFFTLFGLVLPRARARRRKRRRGRGEARWLGPWVMIVCRHQHHLSVVLVMCPEP